jgi:hypothetical protein
MRYCATAISKDKKPAARSPLKVRVLVQWYEYRTVKLSTVRTPLLKIGIPLENQRKSRKVSLIFSSRNLPLS